jgi:hypothetical protein
MKKIGYILESVWPKLKCSANTCSEKKKTQIFIKGFKRFSTTTTVSLSKSDLCPIRTNTYNERLILSILGLLKAKKLFGK